MAAMVLPKRSVLRTVGHDAGAVGDNDPHLPDRAPRGDGGGGHEPEQVTDVLRGDSVDVLPGQA